ncbi:MAG: hypothetical protein ACI4HI_10065 [Lachnospiraceae bacterium]
MCRNEKVTNSLKQRFCKDRKLSIQVYREPYFSERIELLGAGQDYREFENLLEEKFENDQETYFAYADELQEKIIAYIKNSETFIALNKDDMNQYAVDTNVRKGNVFGEAYEGKKMLSIDLAKANFSALVYYGKLKDKPFHHNSYSWEEFMKQFTDISYFARSKYLRQVVFGNCNPKRQITFEKYIMSIVLKELQFHVNVEHAMIAFYNDEIVFDADLLSEDEILTLKNKVLELSEHMIPLHYELFEIGHVLNTKTYMKKMIDSNNGKTLELKCNNPIETILIQRKLHGEEIRETDKVFMSEYGLAELLHVPEIELPF